MSKVTIVTDSTSYLPAETLKALGISTVPLHVIWGEVDYIDNVTIKSEDFYSKLPHAKVLPSTSQPSPKEFMNVYKPILESGNEIVSLHISSRLSGTIDSANQAAKMLHTEKVSIFDSLSTSMGLGFQVIAAAQAAAAGKNREECIAAAEKVRSTSTIFFIVKTLEFLKKGGRIGSASALLGTALDLKPILTLVDGKIEAHSKVRTFKKAMQKTAEMVAAQAEKSNKLHTAYINAEAKEDMAFLLQEVKNLVPSLKLGQEIEAGISPAIGTHTGPGTVGICFYTE